MCNGTCKYGLENKYGDCVLSDLSEAPCENAEYWTEEDCKELLAEERADSEKSRI